jgi:APA family basic amino acid/polyamine antiporter
MGRDYPALKLLSGAAVSGGAGERDRGPIAAIMLQVALALIMVLSASFDELLTYIGFTLSLFAALTIAGVFVLRAREPGLARPYKAWGHPFTTVCALLLNAWMLLHALWERPAAAAAGLVTLGSGLLLYLAVRSRQRLAR